MKINRKIAENRWERFDDDVEFLIRRFPYSRLVEPGDTGKLLFDPYDYCLVDWKGLFDEDGKPFDYDVKNKRLLFDYYTDIREFVFKKIIQRKEEEMDIIKN